MNILDEISITYVMLEHHKKINSKLDNLLNGVGMSNAELQNAWEDFCETLRKHVLVEEQVIFSFSNLGSGEIQKVVRELLGQHGQIREYLSSINFNRNTSKPELTELRKFLFDHEAIENDVLYPMIDRELDEHGRNFLLAKIK